MRLECRFSQSTIEEAEIIIAHDWNIGINTENKKQQETLWSKLIVKFINNNIMRALLYKIHRR